MVDDEGVKSYIHRVNEIVNAIRGFGRKIEGGNVVRNILFTLPKPYKPKTCTIEEIHDLDKYTIDQLLGSPSTYELSDREDIKRERKEVAFNISNMIEDELETSENMDEIEAKFEDYKRFYDDEKKDRYKRYDKKKKEKNKEMSKRLEGMKNKRSSVSEKTTLHAKVESESWIIDFGCLNYMINDKEKFLNHERYDGGSVKFVGEEVAPICRIGSITIDGKHKSNDVYCVEGLRHNLLSGQI
ncbi:uncharacterized protein LOC131857588 [Cryptomeria japonica]|uniref:uncharacterized protein LOC131857588 n=1 Tax=Cryptomeria japonica TaxID=3369 RepID=UPI0027DA121A|nr:uncharacterized protein LOC131857588 [Cryptomeria japonica]